MDKLLKAASSVAEQVFKDYAKRGGVIRDGARKLTVTEAAGQDGALAPILWMLREFIVEYDIEFPAPRYEANPQALTGVSLAGLEVSSSSSPSIFMLADFLRNELVPSATNDVDLSLLFGNFREWAADNVPGFSPAPQQPGATQPE